MPVRSGTKLGKYIIQTRSKDKDFTASSVIVEVKNGWTIWRSSSVGKGYRKRDYWISKPGEKMHPHFSTLEAARKRIATIASAKKAKTPKRKSMPMRFKKG